MTRMMRGVFGAVAAVALSVAPAAAQDADCRCVDADGNEIERCSCFRAPRFDAESLLGRVSAMSARPRLGISLDASQSARRDADGALVTDVLEGGPADEAGIRSGDVITRIDGQSLTSPMGADAERGFDLDESVPVQRLLAITRDLEEGESVEVEYLRDGERRTATVEPEVLDGLAGALAPALPGWNGEFPEGFRGRDGATAWRVEPDSDHAFGYRFRGGPDGPDVRVFGPDVRVFGPGGLSGSGRHGLHLTEVNPGLGEYFGTEEGVLVLDVEQGAGFGLEPGDVILRIGTRAVTTPDRVRRILSSYADDEDIDFHILRDGEERVVTGRLRY